MKRKLSMLLCAASIGITCSQAQFNANNLAALVTASASANNTTASIVELSKTTPAQTAANTYAIEGTTGATALRFSGSATSTCYLANSNDGSLLLFTGHNTTTTSGNANTVLARGVGSLDASGAFALQTTYTGNSGSQTRCATTLNNTDYYIADQGGLYTNNGTAATITGNYRGIKAFGGTVYVGASSSSTTTIAVSTVSDLTGGTVTGLPGLTNDANMQDFYLIKSGTNGNTYDVLYTVSATSATAGTIRKYSLVSGTWTANGTYTTAFGGFGLAAEAAGTSAAHLYVSTGQGATAVNNLVKLVDQSGYNATLNITTADNVILYTAAAGTTIKGVAFAPAAVAVPAITVNPAAIANIFSASIGAYSASDSIVVSGANLSADVQVTAPASFEVATSLNGTYTSAVTLAQSAGSLATTKVYVRFAPTAAGTVSGNVVFSSAGAADQNVSVTGATPGSVVLTSTATVSPFSAYVNATSASDSFTVSGTDLISDVTITAPASFEIASSLNGTYGASLTYPATSNALAATKVYVRFHPTVSGPASGTLTVSATDATTQNVSLSGNTLVPAVTVSATAVNGFVTLAGTSSASDSFSVEGLGLLADVSLTTNAPFEIATALAGPYSTSVTLTPVTGTLAATRVYVRFSPAAAGTYSDTVKINTQDANERIVLLSGTTVNSTNPAAFNLSSGNYEMNSWDSTSAAGTYPANMIFHTTNIATPLLTYAPLINNWHCAYDLASRPRLKGLNSEGFSFINTGSPQYDDCASGATTQNTYMGAALLAINTTGVDTITLAYKVGLVKQGDGATPRIYKMRLQYRLDSLSAYADMNPLQEYTSAGKTDGDVESISMLLPAELENKNYVQFRWLYYAEEVGSGTRPEIRIDDIRVSYPSGTTTVTDAAAGSTAIVAYPNPVHTGATVYFKQAVNAKVYDMYGRVVTELKDARSMSTSGFAAGIYTIKANNSSSLRIVVQ